MASHVRVALRGSCSRSFQPVLRPCFGRSLSYTIARLSLSTSENIVNATALEDGAFDAEDAALVESGALESERLENMDPADMDAETRAQVVGHVPESHSEFLKTVASKYKHASPRNWLAENTPFPMNPSFRPPPPLADAIKTQIYQSYMQDPEANNIRRLSQRHNLSMKRIDAILRLKGMEADWKQTRTTRNQLQSGFQLGMERLLGAQQPRNVAHTKDGASDAASSVQFATDNANEADILDELEPRDAARQRYQRLYWETVPEDGSESVTPQSLEQAKAHAVLTNKLQQEKLMTLPVYKDTKFIKTPKERVRVVEKEGRPAVMFVDVGAKFVDVQAEAKRRTAADRRQARRLYS